MSCRECRHCEHDFDRIKRERNWLVVAVAALALVLADVTGPFWLVSLQLCGAFSVVLLAGVVADKISVRIARAYVGMMALTYDLCIARDWDSARWKAIRDQVIAVYDGRASVVGPDGKPWSDDLVVTDEELELEPDS